MTDKLEFHPFLASLWQMALLWSTPSTPIPLALATTSSPLRGKGCVRGVYHVISSAYLRVGNSFSLGGADAPLLFFSGFFHVLKSCRRYFRQLSLSHSLSLSLSLSPSELVFAPMLRREYSLISDIHSSPLTDGVITSSAGISAIGHDQSVRFSRRKKIAWLLLTLLINFLLPPRRIFDLLNEGSLLCNQAERKDGHGGGRIKKYRIDRRVDRETALHYSLWCLVLC